MSKINIFHLSDLHFGLEFLGNIKEDVIEKRTKILDNLIEKLENLKQDWKPDIIIISGDIGFSGEKENYVEAWNWLDNLLKKLNLNTESLILCAGNHDRYIKDIINLRQIYPKIEDVDRFLEYDNIKKLEKRFNAFSEFCSNHNIPYLVFNDDENHLIGFREIQELRFVVLNSSWFSLGGENDRGNIFIGLPHILNMKKKEQLQNPDIIEDITISILHHPFEWLNQSEIDKFGERDASYVELARNCDIILSGHTHGEELFEPDKKSASAWLFKAGAVFDKDPLVYNCEIFKIDTINRSADRLKLYYHAKKGWIDEIDEKNPYLFTNGLSRLRFHSKKILNEIYDKIGKKLKVNRTVVCEEIKEELKNSHLYFITGEPHVGKSVILKDLALDLVSEGEKLFFKVSDFLQKDINDYLNNLNIVDNLRDILSSVESVKNRYIFIDESERILESENKLSIFKDLTSIVLSFNRELNLKSDSDDLCWKLIICCRSEKYKNIREITDRLCESLELQINNKKIEPFSTEELHQVSEFYPKLALLINHTHLSKLIILPKILDILTFDNFRLAEGDIIESYPHRFYTETFLMKQFWEQIVRNNEQISIENIRPEEMDQFLQKLAIYYFNFNEPYKISDEDNEILFSDLVSKRILSRDGDKLEFTHDIFEEWSLLRYINQKSDILNDFLIPSNDSNRNNRAFQLFSRKVLEIDGDCAGWKGIYKLLEQNTSLNLNWKQDFIYGLLKSEVLYELLAILKNTLVLEENKVLKEIFKLMRIKCVIFEEELKPDINVWFPIILYIIDNLFFELSNNALFQFTKIVENWLLRYHIQVEEFFDKIFVKYIEFAKTKILIDVEFEDFSFRKELELKKNILFTILWGVVHKSDETTQFLDELIEFEDSKKIFEEVLFDKQGYILLCRHVPDYALKVLKLYLIKKSDIPERIDGYHDPLRYHSFFKDFHYEFKAPFYNFLTFHEDNGLTLIHDIVNQATKIWIATDQPLVYGPFFKRFSNHSTPLPQKIHLNENESIEVWGDEDVYSWSMPLGMCPNVIKYALNALERWSFNQVINNDRDLQALIVKILKATNSFSTVAVLVKLSLHILDEIINEDLDFDFDDIIRGIKPILKKPAFWNLDLTRSIKYGMGLNDYRSQNLEVFFTFIKFYLRDEDLKNELLSEISHFSDDIFVFFEEEKSFKPILIDRYGHMRRLVEQTKDENWQPVEINGKSALQFVLPEELRNKIEEEYINELLTLNAIKNWIYFSFKEENVRPQYNLKDLLKYIEKLIEKDKDVKIPKAFSDHSADRAEVITGFFSLLILYDWKFLENHNLENKALQIILRAIERSQAIGYIKSSVSLYTMGYKRSAAIAIPLLYQKFPKDKRIKKAILELSVYYNNQVRYLLFKHLGRLWKDNYELNWKCINQIFKESIKRGVINKNKYYIINPFIKTEHGFSPVVQFKNVKKGNLLKLKIKRSLEIINSLLRKSDLAEINPEDIDLDFFNSVLYIFPEDERILEIFPEDKFLSYIEKLLLFTINADIYYKNDYKKNQDKYHSQNPNFYYYEKWGNKAFSIICSVSLFFEPNYVKENIIKPILSEWRKSENIMKSFLRELIIASEQADEKRFIDIWYFLADHLFNLIQKKEKIHYEIINLIFFQSNYDIFLKKNLDLDISIEKLDIIIRKFLNQTTYYYPIIKLVNELKIQNLYETTISLLYIQLRTFTYNEDRHLRLRRELYNLNQNYWSQSKEKIKADQTLFQKLNHLTDLLIEWGEPLAGKLKEDLLNSNTS